MAPQTRNGSVSRTRLVPALAFDLSKLNVVGIREDSKKTLLQGYEAQDITAEELLLRLERLNPAVRQEFEPKPKLDPDVPLRLLCERTRLTRGGGSRSFIALSYTWHNPGWSCAVGYEDRDRPGYGQWPISNRLLRCVLEQRISKDEGIWIDQLCINQRDDVEKAKIIGAMDLIYSKARLVLIIFEDVLLSSDEASLISGPYFTEDFGPSREFTSQQQALMMTVAIKILSARWFTRGWCVHELELSKVAKFLVPSENNIITVDPNMLASLWHYIHYSMDVIDEEDTARLTQEDRLNSLEKSFAVISRFQEQEDPVSIGYSRVYMGMFNDIVNLSCSVESDKIRICLNVTGLPLSYKGSAENKSQCQWLLTVIALASGEANALCGFGDVVESSSGNSWLRWYDDLESKPAGDGSSFPISCQTSIREVRQDRLCMDFINFVNPIFHPLRIASLTVVERFVSNCRRSVEGFYDQMGISEHNDYIREDLRRYVSLLACSLDCGLDWMVIQAFSFTVPSWYDDLYNYIDNAIFLRRREAQDHDIIDEILDESARERLEMCIGLWQAVEENLFPLGNVQSSSSLSRTQCHGLHRYILFVRDHFRDHTADSEPLYQHNDMALDTNIPVLCWIDLGMGQKALTLKPNGAVLAQHNPLRIVVPQCLRGPHCYGARRLWIVKKGHKGSTVIVGKAPLFTFFPITPNGTRLKALPQQLITGTL